MIEQILKKLNSIPADKVFHFASGIILFAGFSWLDAYVAFAIVAISAVCKEIYDYFHKDIHTPDVYDCLATIFGAVVGIFIKFV